MYTSSISIALIVPPEVDVLTREAPVPSGPLLCQTSFQFWIDSVRHLPLESQSAYRRLFCPISLMFAASAWYSWCALDLSTARGPSVHGCLQGCVRGSLSQSSAVEQPLVIRTAPVACQLFELHAILPGEDLLHDIQLHSGCTRTT